MNLRSCFLLLLIGVAQFAFAQKNKAIHLTYKWDEAPVIHTLSSEMTNYPATYILHHRTLELRMDAEPHSYFTEHKILRINTNAGIEKYNKVYIPMHGGKQLLSIQVRAIDPSGKVTNLKKENLKELENVDGFGNYRIFAVEGLAVGGEMEYLYTTRESPQVYGREIFQDEIPVIESKLELVYPDNFIFTTKQYNGLEKPVADSYDESRRSISVSASNIPALLEEEYAAHEANKMRLDFKMESNGRALTGITWQSISQRFVTNTYESGAATKVKKFLKGLNLENKSELEKVQGVEKYVKTNFTIKRSGHDAYEDTKSVIENHVGSERGILRLYMSCWEALELLPELVLCSNRFKGKMDPDFSSPHDISDVIFYFPNLDKYLTPDTPYMRLGAAPDNLASGNALFVRYMVSANKVLYLGHTFREIKPLDHKHNDVGVHAVLNFNDNLALPDVKQRNFWQGYRATLYRGIYHYRNAQEKEEFIREVTLSGIDDATVKKRVIEGDNMDLSFDPENNLNVTTEYTAQSLVEKAGEDYLIAVGKVIGKQSELYQEKERKLDIEFASISDYNHEIVLNIPTGYTFSGLEAIKINNELRDGEKVVMRFYSDYTLEGNKLTIKVNEVYKVLKVAKKDYVAFRDVINSAADFNKVVLVLSKTSE
jgi:hypothetical protein